MPKRDRLTFIIAVSTFCLERTPAVAVFTNIVEKAVSYVCTHKLRRLSRHLALPNVLLVTRQFVRIIVAFDSTKSAKYLLTKKKNKKASQFVELSE